MLAEKTVMEQNGKSGCDGTEQLFELTEDCVLDFRGGKASRARLPSYILLLGIIIDANCRNLLWSLQ